VREEDLLEYKARLSIMVRTWRECFIQRLYGEPGMRGCCDTGAYFLSFNFVDPASGLRDH
jgi:hypothetical protein